MYLDRRVVARRPVMGRPSHFYLSYILALSCFSRFQRKPPRSAQRCSMATPGGRIRVHRTQNANYTHATDDDLDTQTQGSEDTVHQFSRFNSTHSSQHIDSSSTAHRLRDLMSKLGNPTNPPKAPPSEPDSDFDVPSGRPSSGDSLKSIFQRATRDSGDSPEIKRTRTGSDSRTRVLPRDTTDDEDTDRANRAYHQSNYLEYFMC